MRIAYVCMDRGVRPFGTKGSAIHVQEVIRGLRTAGATVELFTRRRGGAPPPDLADLRVRRVPVSAGDEAVVKERASLEANGALDTLLERTGPFDLVYERHALWTHAGMEYAERHAVPGLLEVNAPLLEEQRRYRRLLLEHEAEESAARAFRAAPALLAVSDEVGEHLERHDDARGRVHVVPNGVDVERFAPDVTPAWPAPDGTFTIGFVGTLKPWHGVSTLIEAFATLHREDARVRLVIVGDGPQREELDALARSLGIEAAVLFPGTVAPSHMPAALSSMDVAVAPYPKLERFYFSPLKMFEYMAAARPVVASEVGQLRSILVDGETALLYPAGDVPSLTTALRRLRDDAELRRRLGHAARRQAVERHTWTAVVDRILEVGHGCAATAAAASSRPA